MADGRELPVNPEYLGVDKNTGLHVWATEELPEPPTQIVVGVMPGRTTIEVRVARPVGEE